MNCPNCKEAMLVLEIEQVEIDNCIKCGGVWLDSGELELLIEDQEQKDSFLESTHSVDDCPEPKIRCPLCRKKMTKIGIEKIENLVLDSCPRNHGLWLDKGELEGVLAGAGNLPGSPVMILLKEIFAENKE